MAAPKLRFKEFSKDWGSKKIIELADYVDYRGKTPKKVESGVLLVTAKNIKQGYLDYSASQEFIEESAFDDVMRRGKVELNDVLITTEAPLGNVASVDRTDIALAQRVIKYRGKIGLLDNLFLKQKFLSESFQEILKSKATGGTVQGIKGSVLHQIPLIVPSKEEQTKIASFLSAVDEKISQLTQKHELLSQYKQGMMQKLFSQQIRFKADDGSEFGEWENKTLSNFIIKHIGGASLKPSDFVEQSEYEVIPKKAIVPNGYLNLDKDNPTYCSEDFFKANLKNTVDNTYLVTVLRDLVPSGPSIGYIVKYMENTQYILAQGVYGFKLKEELNKDFLIHFSNTKAYRLVMQSIMVGSTQVHIRNQDFFGIEIPVPCLEEQTKIANFLSAIDQKIEVVAQQIEQAKTWKKGLLQQMFV